MTDPNKISTESLENGLGVSPAAANARGSNNPVPKQTKSDLDIFLTHGLGRPREAIGGDGPDASQGTPIGENGEGPFVDSEWLRSVDDLNKEFTNHIRNYGTVIMGREVRGPLGKRIPRQK